MKNNMNVNKKLSNIIFMAAFALFTWMWSDKYDGVITSVLGGIETESDIIDILGLGKWLFLFAVYFLILNKMLVDNRKTLLFSLYRYRDFKSWWKQYFLRLHITMFLYYLISCIVWYVIGGVTDNSSSHAVEIMIIFYMHLAMYFSIIAAADRILNKSIMPCILILIEGVTYIISVQYRHIVLTFGMYRRMALMDNKWFQVIVPGIEFIVCWLCYFSVIRLWKKDKLELL